MKMQFAAQKNRRGQGLVEYIIIVAAVAMISLVAVSIFGHKVADQYAIGAGMLPGAHGDDNNAIETGFYAGIQDNGAGANVGNGAVSWASVTGNADADGDLENNVVAAGDIGAATGETFVAE